MGISNVRIGIIDTRICTLDKCFCKVQRTFDLKCENEREYQIVEKELEDNIGHGTAVADIICDINPNIEFYIFRVSENENGIDERGLTYVLEYIYSYIEVDIINISLGCTYLFDYASLKGICKRLTDRGVLLVSAFDNDGAISFPAAYDEVIGVDINANILNRKSLQLVKRGIVDVFVPNIYYRTFWKNKVSIVAGTSFAAARVTGILSLKIDEWLGNRNKQMILETIVDGEYVIDEPQSFAKPDFLITRAIIFPINKETRAILQFHELLNFELVGAFDERLNGNIGKEINGFKISSYLEIDWENNFDTVILSCTEDLSELTGIDYRQEFVQKVSKYNKKIYSFEMLQCKNMNVFYPIMNNRMVPKKNLGKLHHVTIPIIGVMGTSSQQGKFTLQLEIIKRLRKLGYKVGHIATEPSGYLFDADYVYHFGYHANLDIYPHEMIAILNEMIWRTQLLGKDIIIAGSQSNTIHYIANNLENYPIDQYSFILGIQADCYILCVNPHDSIEYIMRTINFINSIDEGKVIAIVVFPIKTIEVGVGLKYVRKFLNKEELEIIRNKLEASCNMTVYALDDMEQLDKLTDKIVDFFSEDECNVNI